MEYKQPIPARLFNAAKGGHVAGALDIIDDTLEKTQDQINQETVGTDNASLKNRINAIQLLVELSGTDNPVPLTTSSDDIVTTGEGAVKIPLCIAVAGKFAEYYNKIAVEGFIHNLELVDQSLLGTDLDTAETNSIKGLRKAIVQLSLGVVGTDEDTSEVDTLKGLRAAISSVSRLLQEEIENRQSQYNSLLGTDEDSFETNTIMGLRKTIVGLSDIVNGLTPGEGGGGESSGIGSSVELYNFLEELRVTKLPKLEADVNNILNILDADNSSEQIQSIINKYNQISEFIETLGDGDSEEALSNIITRISNLESDISRLNRLIENIHVGSANKGMKHIVLTQSQYEALEEFEEDALYLVTEDEEGWVFPIILREVESEPEDPIFPIELI